jgi:multisubunit Na+/H+ antiporter MnhF subunit
MNLWLWAALALLAGEVPLLWRLLRGHLIGALAALQQGQVVTVLVLLSTALGIHQPSFFDLALALSLLSAPGGLVFARFLERWA